MEGGGENEKWHRGKLTAPESEEAGFLLLDMNDQQGCVILLLQPTIFENSIQLFSSPLLKMYIWHYTKEQTKHQKPCDTELEWRLWDTFTVI